MFVDNENVKNKIGPEGYVRLEEKINGKIEEWRNGGRMKGGRKEEWKKNRGRMKEEQPSFSGLR